jgi:glycosyltransferase involved in cell wall biosynthesis
MTKISIAMATYNGEMHLAEQLNSLLSQSFLPLELQIGDDGSTDNTEELVKDFAARAPFPVHYHRNGTNLGYGENFLRTAQRCTGDWIAFCDQDDIWLNHKLDTIRSVIEQSGEDVSLVAHNAVLVDQAMNRLEAGPLQHFSNKLFEQFELSADWLCAGFRQVFRRDLISLYSFDCRIGTMNSFSAATGYDPRPHDSWIPFIANMSGSIRTLADELVLYRRHTSNATILHAPGGEPKTYLNNASAYQRSADWYGAAAIALVEAAPKPAPVRVSQAALRLLEESRWLQRRAAIYQSRSAVERLHLVAGQVRTGFYGRSWSARPAGFLKDLSYALVGDRILKLAHVVASTR